MKDISLRLTLDDLIFEGRNKLYGAYALRKDYPRHMAYATLVAVCLLALLIPLPELLNKYAPPINPAMPNEHGDKVTVIDVYLPPPPATPKELPSTAGPAAAPKPTVEAPADSRNVPTFVTDPTGVTVTDPGDLSLTGGQDGTTGTAPTVDNPLPATGTGTGDGTATGTGTAPLIHEFAEVLPQFPGGDAALFNAISKNVKYPTQALERNVSGTVLVSFVVDLEGNVSQVKVLKGIGAGCDEEAVRVISLLKGWSPATQHGRPVFFKYVLPVRFVLRN